MTEYEIVTSNDIKNSLKIGNQGETRRQGNNLSNNTFVYRSWRTRN